jgi:hypothetical protein
VANVEQEGCRTIDISGRVPHIQFEENLIHEESHSWPSVNWTLIWISKGENYYCSINFDEEISTRNFNISTKWVMGYMEKPICYFYVN